MSTPEETSSAPTSAGDTPDEDLKNEKESITKDEMGASDVGDDKEGDMVDSKDTPTTSSTKPKSEPNADNPTTPEKPMEVVVEKPSSSVSEEGAERAGPDETTSVAQKGQPEKRETSGGTEDSAPNQTEGTTDNSVASNKELPYSTRGRTTEKEPNSGTETLSAIEVLEEIGRVKDAPASLGVSFLESINEEDRHTRTRFIPNVEGMHALRKNEVRDDLGLARTMVASSGTKQSRGRKSDSMDIDDAEGVSPSEDGGSDTGRSGTKTLELPTRDLVIPSNAFVAPPEGGSLKSGVNGVQSPGRVEAVTAFNPPRPPESIGAKKKHRMLRWERRPEDVEVDLNNYKKTVQRTRQELHKAEAEYTRLETIDSHLRWHFLNHLNLMNEEYALLNEELTNVQQECVKTADLLTSRTRSRGAGKGSFVMRDVLQVLKSKGTENTESMDTDVVPVVSNPVVQPGIGGLTSCAFQDWDRKTVFKEQQPASAWTVPGDKVQTPYGDGVVLEVFPAQIVSEEEESNHERSSNNGASIKKKSKSSNTIDEKNDLPVANSLLPRVSVKLPFGVGYFPVDTIKPLENPCKFSDSRLCQRWTSLMTTALSVGSTIDVEGRDIGSTEHSGKADGAGRSAEESAAGMDVDGSDKSTASKVVESDGGRENDGEERQMPLVSCLLPTATGRGALLQSMPLTQIEKGLEKALYHGRGHDMGKVSMECKKWGVRAVPNTGLTLCLCLRKRIRV